MGYHRAGFDVVGVDNKPQPRYPFAFERGDALTFLWEKGRDFDVIHASPPCQAYSHVTPRSHAGKHPDMIDLTREMLCLVEKPYVIENVTCARHLLDNPIKLCGTMFGLRCYRHRYFEIYPSLFFLVPPCDHSLPPLLVTTAGQDSINAGNRKTVKNAPQAYGIDWMDAKGLCEAIPPAYTEFIGRKLMTLFDI